MLPEIGALHVSMPDIRVACRSYRSIRVEPRSYSTYFSSPRFHMRFHMRFAFGYICTRLTRAYRSSVSYHIDHPEFTP